MYTEKEIMDNRCGIGCTVSSSIAYLALTIITISYALGIENLALEIVILLLGAGCLFMTILYTYATVLLVRDLKQMTNNTQE